MKLINKPVVLLVFSLVLLLSIGSVCASEDIGVSDIDNFDLGVSSLSEVPVDDNNVNNLGANPGSFSDLESLINNTSAGATLDLTDDYSFNKNTDNNKGIFITKDITINGNGHTLDAKNCSRLFDIEYSNVVINDLNFKVNTTNEGDLIYSRGSNLTLNACYCVNNSFIGNFIYFYRGMNSQDRSNLNIICCNFANNYVSNGRWGPNYLIDTYNNGYDRICINSSSFINNHGGVISSWISHFEINNCDFINNSDVENGNIYTVGSVIGINNCNFINNSASYGGVIFSEGVYDFGGGSNINISHSYFLNNNATYGGCICLNSIDAFRSSVRIISSVFINNSASNRGGVISSMSARWSLNSIKVYTSILDGNDAPLGKVAFYQKQTVNNRYIIFQENYWGMNFTTVDEFMNADLVSTYDDNGTYSVAPYNWVLMSIYAPDELKVGVSTPIIVKLDKLTNGSSISDFTGSLPDYYTSAYAFTKSENDNYNYKWDDENPDVGSSIGNLWIRNGEGSFNFTAPTSGEYVFRTHSPFTIWEEAVTTTATAPFYNMSITESTLNKTVYVGNQTEFLIVVNNTGDSNLTGVYVVEKSSDDMVYDSWRPVSGNWVYSFVDGVHRWTLDGSLAPNETASFILVFNTTSVGNKTNIVLGGSNELDNLSAENVTEVINKTKPNPNPDPNPDPTPDPTPTPTPEPNPVHGNGGSDSVVSKMVSTGNPLALIIISLFTIFVGGLKRKI